MHHILDPRAFAHLPHQRKRSSRCLVRPCLTTTSCNVAVLLVEKNRGYDSVSRPTQPTYQDCHHDCPRSHSTAATYSPVSCATLQNKDTSVVLANINNCFSDAIMRHKAFKKSLCLCATYKCLIYSVAQYAYVDWCCYIAHNIICSMYSLFCL